MGRRASPGPHPSLPRNAGEGRGGGAPRLAVEGLGKSFDGRAAMAEVSFAVAEHEFVAVLGPSGAGKTTLFRCIAGLIPSDQGAARVDGDGGARRDKSERRQVAVI